MKNHILNRRSFLGLTAAGLAVMGRGSLVRAASAMVARDPDLIVVNAKVYTVDSRQPTAESFAVKDGRFVAVGSTADIRALAGVNTEIFDAQHMTIVPGFNDSHNHAPGNELLYEVLVGNPYDVEAVSIASIIDKLRARASTTPADTWVEGFFYDDTKSKDRRALTVHDLDLVSKDLPVVVIHRGGHTAFYNSKALKMAGIDKSTPNPAGGTYDRDATGELTGRVTDNARSRVDAVGKRRQYSGEEALRRDRDGLAFISKQFVRFGLTSVCHESGNLHALQQIRDRGALLHRGRGQELDELPGSSLVSGGVVHPDAERLHQGAVVRVDRLARHLPERDVFRHLRLGRVDH